jgi:23S rRNA pseudouridine2605 synthase
MGVSRREADDLIKSGAITVNGNIAVLGQPINDTDQVAVNGQPIRPETLSYIMLNKPIGYVCSRRQQGDSPTIYDLLPGELRSLKVAGRLDADSRGLVVLTNDGDYAQRITHPRFAEIKKYEVKLNKKLGSSDAKQLTDGVDIGDGVSRLTIEPIANDSLLVTLAEGRNRQIRRSFEALGYQVIDLRRIEHADIKLPSDLPEGLYAAFAPKKAS